MKNSIIFVRYYFWQKFAKLRTLSIYKRRSWIIYKELICNACVFVNGWLYLYVIFAEHRYFLCMILYMYTHTYQLICLLHFINIYIFPMSCCKEVYIYIYTYIYIYIYWIKCKELIFNAYVCILGYIYNISWIWIYIFMAWFYVCI